MTTTTTIAGADQSVYIARAMIADALAAALRDAHATPDMGAPEADVLCGAFAHAAASLDEKQTNALSLGEIAPASTNARPLTDWYALSVETRRAALQAVFGFVVSRECPPLETEFIPSKDAATRAQHLADLAGFYRAFGLTSDPATPRRADHICLHLGFISVLNRKLAALTAGGIPADDAAEQADVCLHALRSFLVEHVCWWVPTFARRLELHATAIAEEAIDDTAQGLRVLARLARFIRAWMALERISAGCEPIRRIVGPNVDEEIVGDDECLAADGVTPCDGCGPAPGAASTASPSAATNQPKG